MGAPTQPYQWWNKSQVKLFEGDPEGYLGYERRFRGTHLGGTAVREENLRLFAVSHISKTAYSPHRWTGFSVISASSGDIEGVQDSHLSQSRLYGTVADVNERCNILHCCSILPGAKFFSSLSNPHTKSLSL